MRNQGREKRRYKRIEHPYLIRFRQINPEFLPVRWEVTTVRDMSKSGMLFYSPHYYKPGCELEINLRAPLLAKQSTFWALVIRCRPTTEVKDYYEIAVNVSRIDETTRTAFDKTIEFFLKKRGGKERTQIWE